MKRTEKLSNKLSTTFKQPRVIPLVMVGLIAVALASGFAIQQSTTASETSASVRRVGSQNTSVGRNNQNQAQTVSGETAHVAPLPASQASNSSETTKQLLYLIKEEKLAHDVYQTMSELWGARIFANIQRSETNHQDQLLAVMQSRGIADPRSTEVGVFTDQKLQTLYNQLIAQGSQSLSEAYKVGVAIEELDIADIKVDLATLDPTDSDVKATMENLLRGSENHLKAFSRQTGR